MYTPGALTASFTEMEAKSQNSAESSKRYQIAGAILSRKSNAEAITGREFKLFSRNIAAERPCFSQELRKGQIDE